MAYERNKYTQIAPATLSSGNNDLVADPGDGYEAVLVEVGFQNVDTVTRTLIIKRGSTVLRQWDLATLAVVEVSWPEGLEWVAAASTAIVANASAGSAIKVTGGRWYKRPAR